MRIFVVVILFFSFVQASSLFREIENITGKNTYIANKKIIRTLFKNERAFYSRGHIDYDKVLTILKKNHLLPVKLSRATQISLGFATRQRHPVAFIKLVRDSLHELGYSRIDIQKVIQDASGFLYKVNVYSDSAPDPIAIVESFAKKGCDVVKIKRFSIANWRYFVDIRGVEIVPEKLPRRKKVHLPKPLEPYWINVSDIKVVLFNSSRANRWHPDIVFYDRFMNVIDNFSKDIKSYNIRLEVPENARYMKVRDLYTLDNIRRGLTIYLADKK